MESGGFLRYKVDISKNFKSLMDISGNFILIEFSGISRLVKSSKFLKYKVDISKNLKLIDFSGFPRF